MGKMELETHAELYQEMSEIQNGKTNRNKNQKWQINSEREDIGEEKLGKIILE